MVLTQGRYLCQPAIYHTKYGHNMDLSEIYE